MLETNNWTAVREIADEFAERTEGTYNGCIGALDGLAVCVNASVLPMSQTLATTIAKNGFTH